ncbi:MAG: hypothetical protein H6737_16985 [Alphaproteobacteria bacterium]|nr:hypothetical protein [Alphaproteobacteria bacterium]
MDEALLERVVDVFVDRMFDDFVIGFRFDGKDRVRVKRHEFELARKHVLGTGSYTGRPIGPLHRAMRINAGQFRRRLAILRTVLREHGVEDGIIDAWIEHDRKLEPVLTDGTDCVPPEP